MSASPSPFDASASALGYLYQCRYALLLALQKGDDLDLGISVEKLDDVVIDDAERLRWLQANAGVGKAVKLLVRRGTTERVVTLTTVLQPE